MTPPTVEEALAYARKFKDRRTAGRVVPADALVVLAEEVARLRADAARRGPPAGDFTGFDFGALPDHP